MYPFRYILRTFFFSSIIFMLPGFICSQSYAAEWAPGENLEGKAIYQARVPAGITYETAIENLISILGGEFGSFGLRYYARRDLLYYNTGRVELGALVIGGDLQGLVYDNKQKLIYIRFRSIPLKGDKLIISPQLSVRLRELDYEPVEVVKTSESYKYAIHAGMLSFHFKKEKVAKKFADMLCAVQKFINEPTEEEIKQDAEFKALASKYRELSIKPEMSEEQRKYIVQANTLTKMKDYEGAIEIYLEAIKIDPVSYPGAYSNLGLLSAQLKLYDEAISYMEKYLMLAPDAEDARGAQDKIYEWEILMKKQ